VTTIPAATATLAVLALAGLLPAMALVGLRWITVPLVPLAGAVVAAVAATCYLATGGSFMAWFVGLSVLAAGAVLAVWSARPELRPRPVPAPDGSPTGTSYRVAGIVGAVAVLAACIWCLRGLGTPTVGFDARAVWLLRAGWFLQSHHQLLVKMRVNDVPLIQSVYPPLISASAAVAASVTGDQSVRLGVVVVALLNTCALTAAAFALVEGGRTCAARLCARPGPAPGATGAGGAGGASAVSGAGPPTGTTGAGGAPGPAGEGGGPVAFAPMVVGVVAAVALVFVGFGITEPFTTNGYADPLWSMAAVGAMAYGLQLGGRRAEQGAAVIFVLVTGMTKNEGLATGAALIVLIALRSLLAIPAVERRRRWWRPLVLGAAELAAIGAWPVLMRVIHARGVTSSSHSPIGTWPGRARATADGMAPYLHVLVLAAPIAVVGGLVLSRVRRAGGVGNDWWSWVALAGGLTAIGGALVTGVGAIEPWLETTVHRVTEFAALAGWWIVAMWAVVAAGAPSWERERRAVLPDGTAARPGEGPDGEPPPAALGGPHGEGGRMDPGPTAP